MTQGFERMRQLGKLSWAAWVALCVVAVLAGCASPRYRAPVEDRAAAGRTQPGSAPATATPPARPGDENAGKPGYVTVKPGDTLIRIGLEAGQNWRDVARWNGIDNPNLIEVGQVLRVARPGSEPEAVAVRPVTAAAQVETRPLDARAEPRVLEIKPGTASPAAAAAASAPAPATPASDEDVAWGWPAQGGVTTPFDDQRHKGLLIAGKAGEPVYAAAAGRVVYVGADLRGYGNLVIVKHNNTYLSAYAHNQALLVKEEQVVRKGQKIAEMGSSDTDRVQLHFEIRRVGKPVDPARLLPAR